MQTLGEYQVTALIGRGGMAEVYRGLQAGPGGFARDVCLKVLRSELATGPGFVEMFKSEAQVAAMLQHPNIVQIFDFGEHQGQYFLVMEYVDGVSLQTLLDDVRSRGYRLPLEFITYVMEGLLLALRYAHSETFKGPLGPVVHRDISPHNVLISRQGAVKLADFGIAKVRNLTPETAVGVIKGKLPYMSPEQLRGEAVSPRSDLFSAGALFFELLTSRRLFRREERAEIAEQILQCRPRPIKGLSPSVNQLLADMLNKDPSARVESAGAALDGLKALGIPVCGKEPASHLVKNLLGVEGARVGALPVEHGPRASQPDAETRVSDAPPPGLTDRDGRGTSQGDD